jgi:hypothetical protein
VKEKPILTAFNLCGSRGQLFLNSHRASEAFSSRHVAIFLLWCMIKINKINYLIPLFNQSLAAQW